MNDPLLTVKEEIDLYFPLKIEVPEEIDPDRPLNTEDPLHVPIDVPDSIKEEADVLNEEKTAIEKNLKENRKECGLAKVKVYQCNVCQKIFPDARKLNRHGRSHNTQNCSICNNEFASKDSLNMHTKMIHQGISRINATSNQERIQCKICEKHLACKDSLSKHNRAFHRPTSKPRERPFECQQCKNTYLTSSHMKDHIKVVHENIKKYKCEVCSNEFTTSCGLKRHTNSKHDKIRSYKCGICNKAFARNFSLTEHQRNVHERKKVECEICSKGFLNRNELSDHIQVVHNGKQHICDICDKVFDNYISWHAHKKCVHKLYQCNKCSGKTFPNSVELRNHMDVVHNGVQFKCNICQNVFTSMKSLETHTNTFHLIMKYT